MSEALNVQEAEQREVSRLTEGMSSFSVKPSLPPVIYDSLEQKPLQAPIHLDRVLKQLVVKAIALPRQIVPENTKTYNEMNDRKFDNNAEFRKYDNETTLALYDLHC